MTTDYWSALVQRSPRLNFIIAGVSCLLCLLLWPFGGVWGPISNLLSYVSLYFVYRAYAKSEFSGPCSMRKPWIVLVIVLVTARLGFGWVEEQRRNIDEGHVRGSILGALWATGKTLFASEPPVKLWCESRSGLLGFGSSFYLIITNKSEQAVTPSEAVVVLTGGKKQMVSVPRILMPYQTVELRMPDPPTGLEPLFVELECDDYGKSIRVRVPK